MDPSDMELWWVSRSGEYETCGEWRVVRLRDDGPHVLQVLKEELCVLVEVSLSLNYGYVVCTSDPLSSI